MNVRKQHVIKVAHQLFINKGFQATSIQDILDESKISKGTFYNYFSSKNELLIELFKTLFKQLRDERDKLLIGQDRSDIEIFIKQIELNLQINRANKLISLFEEVYVSNDEDLKQFLKQGHIRVLNWVYNRFIDIFGEDKKPYLLDCAVMLLGVLQSNLKYNALAYESHTSISRVVRYSVNRIANIVEEVAKSGEQLIQPERLQAWLPANKHCSQDFQQDLVQIIAVLKKSLINKTEQNRYTELLDFIEDELVHAKTPRRFLVESALASLKSFFDERELQQLEETVESFFNQIEN